MSVAALVFLSVLLAGVSVYLIGQYLWLRKHDPSRPLRRDPVDDGWRITRTNGRHK